MRLDSKTVIWAAGVAGVLKLPLETIGRAEIARAGIVTGLVEVPLRYMHTPCEIISLDDADKAAELLAQTCASISSDDNWTP